LSPSAALGLPLLREATLMHACNAFKGVNKLLTTQACWHATQNMV
jgi:hypothetical protein